MFVKPSAFEYLLFDLGRWEELPFIEKARAAVYFSKNKTNPDSWESIREVVELFGRFISPDKVIKFRR